MSERTTSEASKRALIKYPFLQDLDGKEVNGARAYFLIMQQVDWEFLENGETLAHAVTDTLRYMMMAHPGMIDAMFSPDGILRRLREAKEALEEEGLIQPALQNK